MQKVIDRGKRSKILSEVKPVEYISKNPQSFLVVVFYINRKAMHVSNRILSD